MTMRNDLSEANEKYCKTAGEKEMSDDAEIIKRRWKNDKIFKGKEST